MTATAGHPLHTNYRPDIDGLRAIAVLSVVIFHVSPSTLPGGFIGVDVFFVISGYLISLIVFSNLENDSFSIIGFYDRRIRRIAPALLTVVIASVALGWLLLLADEFAQLGKHLAGGAAFVSNLLLYGESGYFDHAAKTKPLLHLWSLAIEEQFYIFWPLLLALVWKRRWSFLRITAVIAVVSFSVSVYLINSNPTAAFYWPISRFWELMIGGLLAYLTLHRPTLLRRGHHIQSALGVILLALGLVLINEERPFPGWWALLPTIGAFFIISAGADAWLNRALLTNRPMVWCGLISYPLYLWHWPLLSYTRSIAEKPSSATKLAVVLLSILLSWLTYQYIERPIRYRKTKSTALALATVLGGVFILGLAMFAGAIPPSSLFFYDIGLAEKTIDEQRALSAPIAQQSHFYDRRVKLIVFGDSQALDIYKALQNETRAGVAFYELSYACTKFINSPAANDRDQACRDQFQRLLAAEELKRADGLIYAHISLSMPIDLENLKQGLREVRQQNPNIKLLLFGTKPLLGKKWVSIRKIMAHYNSNTTINAYLNTLSILRSGDHTARAAAGELGVGFLSVSDVFCEHGCVFYQEGRYLYFDQDHWTTEGAALFFHKLSANQQYNDLIRDPAYSERTP